MTSLEDQTLEREAEEFAVNFSAVVENVERVIRGKTEVIRLALCCMLAEGHLLIEDVPGVETRPVGGRG